MENVNELPIEVLTRIFDYFDVRERRHVSAVCTLWRDILHSVRFQRQCRTFLDGRFEEEFTESEKTVLQSCRNLSIILWDEENESVYDYEIEDDAEGREKEEIIPLTYLFNPTPQQNITDLIFSQKLDLERLDLNSTFVSCREILQDRLEKLENLKELSLLFDFRPVSSSQEVDPQVWSIRHNRIETLRIGLLDDIQPITLTAPNLTILDLKPKCPWILDIIRSYKHQLQSLKIDFQNVESMSTLMMMEFPCLTHLNVQMLEDKDNQIRYARTRNRFVDEEIEERFVKGMPKLKQLLLTSNLMFFRIAKALAKYAYQLEEISLEEQQMDYELLKVVERIPKLRRLTMLRCEVMDLGQVHPTLSLPPCLSELELLHSKSNLVFNKGLAGLKSLNVCAWTSKNHKILHKICKNLPNLEHLTVAFNSPVSSCV
ncbi:uncharacterized protein LOC129768170 isoform X2 [Toxorhynchites rutilus septentrionalis]|uniref:uncharacterized protein LOC129768170 isoform X2 n=1 Tax=Toxorhynchites rutilus septentrionalis TaxID=329112 RepID=UPI00247B0124|nr:uncharacterized protein LOC129768170 isoform X2 [Toxorhynchites rutilus septentrionalis]